MEGRFWLVGGILFGLAKGLGGHTILKVPQSFKAEEVRGDFGRRWGTFGMLWVWAAGVFGCAHAGRMAIASIHLSLAKLLWGQ